MSKSLTVYRDRPSDEENERAEIIALRKAAKDFLLVLAEMKHIYVNYPSRTPQTRDPAYLYQVAGVHVNDVAARINVHGWSVLALFFLAIKSTRDAAGADPLDNLHVVLDVFADHVIRLRDSLAVEQSIDRE